MNRISRLNVVDREVLRITAVFILSKSEGGGRKHRRRMGFGEADDEPDFDDCQFEVLVRETGDIKCESGPSEEIWMAMDRNLNLGCIST